MDKSSSSTDCISLLVYVTKWSLCSTGEWGGQDLDTPGKPDATWHAAFADYIIKLGATDQFYWCLNPTSSDTGGILNGDWATPVQYKLTLLNKVVPQPAKFVLTNGIPTSLNPGGGQSTYSLTPGKSQNSIANFLQIQINEHSKQESHRGSLVLGVSVSDKIQSIAY